MFGLKREIDQIAKDKGIERTEIIRALEEAMKQAARRDRGLESEIEARFNEDLGEIELFEFREVVEDVRGRLDSQITARQCEGVRSGRAARRRDRGEARHQPTSAASSPRRPSR